MSGPRQAAAVGSVSQGDDSSESTPTHTLVRGSTGRNGSRHPHGRIRPGWDDIISVKFNENYTIMNREMVAGWRALATPGFTMMVRVVVD